MSFINHPAKELYCKVAVGGAQSRDWLDALARATGTALVTEEPLVLIEVLIAAPEFSVRGIAPRLMLYAITEGAENDADALHMLFGGADCVVIFLGGPDDFRLAEAALEHAPATAVRVAVRSTSRIISGDGAEPASFGPAVAAEVSSSEGAKRLLRTIVTSIVQTKR